MPTSNNNDHQNLPEATSELEEHYIKTLPLFVSIPRAGCNWIQAVMEIYFDRHRALKGPASPTWLDTVFENPMWMHTHDNFNIASNTTTLPAVFLWRDPVDVVYSMLQLEGAPDFDWKIENYCARFNRCYTKWTTHENVLVLNYGMFVADPLGQLRRLSDWHGKPWDEDAAKKALKKAGDKKSVNAQGGEQKAFKNVLSGTAGYEDNRQAFRNKWTAFIKARTAPLIV